MSDIKGIENEFEFVKYLNGKKINELNPMFRDLINQLFPFEHDKSLIKCWKNHLPQKSDIFIKINNEMKGISIKKGMKNSIHVERITDFIHFLIENNVSRDIIVEYLKFHYADGTTNGKGKKRITTEEYKEKHQKSIDDINKTFNHETLLKKITEKFVLKGNNSKYPVAALICGEVDDFIWITKEDVRKVILSKKDEYSSTVHFGPLTCQPKNRCLNYNSKYEKDRFCVQIKWYNLFDDIIENMNKKYLRK